MTLAPISIPLTVTTSPSFVILSMTPPFAASNGAIGINHKNDGARCAAKRLKDEFAGNGQNSAWVLDTSCGIPNAREVHIV